MENIEIDFAKIGFIIGAGAHVPYGMPVSSQLTEKIKELNHPKIVITNIEKHFNDSTQTTHSSKKAICRLIRQLGIVPLPVASGSSNAHEVAIGQALDKFLDAFAGSQVYSVDAYLAKYIGTHSENDVLVQIGKVVLIYYIAKFESDIPIGYHQSDWIQFIINEYLKELESRDRFFKAPPVIYTFNYDRIIERSILQHLIDFHSIEKSKAIEMVESLQIKHVYGDLGHFKDVFDINNIAHVKEAMSRIKVIGEERLNNTEAFSVKAFEELKVLERVYILGYGYDITNNDLIFCKFRKFLEDRRRTMPLGNGSHPIYKWPEFVSTNIGLSAEDCRKFFSELEFLKIYFGTSEEHLGKNHSYRLLKVAKPIAQAFIKKVQRSVAPRSDYWED